MLKYEAEVKVLERLRRMGQGELCNYRLYIDFHVVLVVDYFAFLHSYRSYFDSSVAVVAVSFAVGYVPLVVVAAYDTATAAVPYVEDI